MRWIQNRFALLQEINSKIPEEKLRELKLPNKIKLHSTGSNSPCAKEIFREEVRVQAHSHKSESKICFNPEALLFLPEDELFGLYAHELAHLAKDNVRHESKWLNTNREICKILLSITGRKITGQGRYGEPIQ